MRSLGCNPEAGRADLAALRPGQVVIGMGDPLWNPQAAAELAKRGVTLFALELIPRITRAQSMDVLSRWPRWPAIGPCCWPPRRCRKMFPMLTTAAGTLTPAKVFIVGAGVAGLQAIATARRLGAVVSAYDVRPAVKEQVQSLGAKFVEMPLDTAAAEGKGGYAKAMDEDFYRRQRELMNRVVAENDVVITTAAIPGKKAPMLITARNGRRHAARLGDGRSGGRARRQLRTDAAGRNRGQHGGVTILGPTNLPADVPYHASQMFAKNVATLLAHLVKDGKFRSTWRRNHARNAGHPRRPGRASAWRSVLGMG